MYTLPTAWDQLVSLLNIHRGDRMKYLVAMDSNPFSLPEYLKEHGKGTEAQKLQNGEINPDINTYRERKNNPNRT